MQAILYIAHGTRMKEGERQAIEFLLRVKAEVHVSIQEIAFLELSNPTVEQGIASCVEQGATEIIVIPLLLFAAQHAKTDIPDILQKTIAQYPKLLVKFGTPIGITRKMVEAVVEQLASVHFPERGQILLVGRGSSDPDIHRDFAEIASRVKLRTGLRNIDIAFLYGKGPQLTEILQANEEREDPLILIPYLLFTGLLIKGLEKIQQQSTREVIISQRLGEVSYTIQAFKESVNKQLKAFEIKEVV